MDRNQTLLINPQKQPSRGVLRKRFLKICSKFTEEHPRRSGIWTKLLCTFIEITLRHGCSPVNLLHFFRTPFPRNTSEWLLLENGVVSVDPKKNRKIFCKFFSNLAELLLLILPRTKKTNLESKPLESILRRFVISVRN